MEWKTGKIKQWSRVESLKVASYLGGLSLGQIGQTQGGSNLIKDYNKVNFFPRD